MTPVDRRNIIDYIISTHTLTWSVTPKRSIFARLNFISTHTLTWSVTKSSDEVFREMIFQLTRSRGAWPSSCVFVTIHIVISTHTLTWSVTHSWMCYNIITVISTHTLTWSVTLAGSHGEILNFHFNSHAHVERDCMLLFWAIRLLAFQLTRSRGAWPPTI